MTGRKVHGGNFRIGTAFELGPAGTAHYTRKKPFAMFSEHFYRLLRRTFIILKIRYKFKFVALQQ